MERHATRGPLRLALVNMPFASARYPSIQLGLLHAAAEQAGTVVDTHNFNLAFAERLGWDDYELLCHNRLHMVGEWLFAGMAWGECAPAPAPYLERYATTLDEALTQMGKDRAWLAGLRAELVPIFLESCLDATSWLNYDVVGFGSVFEQNCAALALARLLKERHPHLTIVFGGSNFDDEMGLEFVRTVPWIDYAVIGEGDEVFPALLQRLSRGEEPLSMAGVARRLPDGTVDYGGRAPAVQEMDALPVPAYNSFFAEAARRKVPRTARGLPVLLPIETARGCWWGAKHHCTFCGLNGSGMAFRSKSPARALADIDTLAARHHVYAFEAVDNIMDRRYVTEVFGPLSEQRKDYTFFYEVKANLTPEQLKAMARGGVRHLQPGIESLSTPVLRLMNKGTTGLQNVRMMKWAQYYGMRVSWNLLYGFPGEHAEDYDRELEWLRRISHLQPPSGIGRIWLERYSPYFTRAAEAGFTNVRPEATYAHIYPEYIDRERIAYFWEYDAPGTLPDCVHHATEAYVRGWKDSWKSNAVPFLTYQRGAGRLTMIDGRTPAAPEVMMYDERAALVYECCALAARGAPQVLDGLRAQGCDTDLASVRRDLDTFVERGLMLEEDGHYFSLALPANPNW